MPAAAPEVEDEISDQDSPNSSPDTGLTVAGIVIAATAFVCCLVLVAARKFMVRRQKDNKVVFSVWSAYGDQRPTRAVTAPELEMGAPENHA